MHDDARPAARLTVLVGPSGAGQGGVIELVRARSPLVWVPVPVTTRPIRDHEADGVHYRFVDRAEFERMITAGGLLEWVELAGHLYGTPRDPVLAQLRTGRPVLIRMDPAGARRIRAALPEAQLVFLALPGGGERSRPGPEYDTTVVNDCREGAADKLVGLLGSSFLTPAQPRVSG
jgi:guanylate kinase